MLNSLYLFIFTIVVFILFIVIKYVLHFKELQKVDHIENADQDLFYENVELAKEKVFNLFDSLNTYARKFLNIFFHFLLHFFVIFLKFISDFTNVLYARSRNFFLKTAAKEKETVTTFWHHLKEYKKEKEEENK